MKPMLSGARVIHTSIVRGCTKWQPVTLAVPSPPSGEACILAAERLAPSVSVSDEMKGCSWVYVHGLASVMRGQKSEVPVATLNLPPGA